MKEMATKHAYSGSTAFSLFVAFSQLSKDGHALLSTRNNTTRSSKTCLRSDSMLGLCVRGLGLLLKCVQAAA